MRTLLLTFLSVVTIFGSTTLAQRNVTPAIERDPILETDAKHNLDVANQYFKLKKAYKSVLSRFEETYAAYPTFSQIDEFLYIAGMSSLYLADGKGKQKVDLKTEKEPEKFTKERLRADAQKYLNELVDVHPQSKFVPEAQKALAGLKASN